MAEKSKGEEAVAIPESKKNVELLKAFSLQNVPGKVWVIKKKSKYELLVVTHESDVITPLFFLKGSHTKQKRAEERAKKTARTWGKG